MQALYMITSGREMLFVFTPSTTFSTRIALFLLPLGNFGHLGAPLGELWRPMGNNKAEIRRSDGPHLSILGSFWGHCFVRVGIYCSKKIDPEEVTQAKPNFIQFWFHFRSPESLFLELPPAREHDFQKMT